ncbi:hypothetical protein F5Y15DRAFT_382310 [Xylariaceae sp. FL0016]|nr:hypothetical protein F5Y15DRAFT_382310 [Xylariaceae sp. FL0016]
MEPHRPSREDSPSIPHSTRSTRCTEPKAGSLPGIGADAATAGDCGGRSTARNLVALNYDDSSMESLVRDQLEDDLTAYRVDANACKEFLAEETSPEERRRLQLRLLDCGHKIRECRQRLARMDLAAQIAAANPILGHSDAPRLPPFHYRPGGAATVSFDTPHTSSSRDLTVAPKPVATPAAHGDRSTRTLIPSAGITAGPCTNQTPSSASKRQHRETVNDDEPTPKRQRHQIVVPPDTTAISRKGKEIADYDVVHKLGGNDRFFTSSSSSSRPSTSPGFSPPEPINTYQRLGYWDCRLCTSTKYFEAGGSRTPSMPAKWPLKDMAKLLNHYLEMHTEHSPMERCQELGAALQLNRGPFEYWLTRTKGMPIETADKIDQYITSLEAGVLPNDLRVHHRAAKEFPNGPNQHLRQG